MKARGIVRFTLNRPFVNGEAFFTIEAGTIVRTGGGQTFRTLLPGVMFHEVQFTDIECEATAHGASFNVEAFSIITIDAPDRLVNLSHLSILGVSNNSAMSGGADDAVEQTVRVTRALNWWVGLTANQVAATIAREIGRLPSQREVDEFILMEREGQRRLGRDRRFVRGTDYAMSDSSEITFASAPATGARLMMNQNGEQVWVNDPATTTPVMEDGTPVYLSWSSSIDWGEWLYGARRHLGGLRWLWRIERRSRDLTRNHRPCPQCADCAAVSADSGVVVGWCGLCRRRHHVIDLTGLTTSERVAGWSKEPSAAEVWRD